MQVIYTPNAPKPIGPYSQGIAHNGFVFVSGQLSIDPATGEKKLGTIEEQTDQVLRNIASVVLAAGGDITTIVRTTVYLTDLSLAPKMNATYDAFFGPHRPARALVPCCPLPAGFLVEIDAIAAIKEVKPDAQGRYLA